MLTYTDTKTAEFERRVAAYARIAMGPRTLLEGPLAASMLFRYPVPKSFTKARRRAVLGGWAPYLGRFDLDNYIKAVKDALNGIVYNDDAQIVRLTALKQPDADPGVDILVKPYERT